MKLATRIFAFAFALAIVLALPVTAHAEKYSDRDGYNGYSWVLDTETGVLSFSSFEPEREGKSALGSFNINIRYADGKPFMPEWYEYCHDIKTIEFEGVFSGIGDYCFYGCDNLTKVTLPAHLQSIGKCAFLGCASLKSISFPSGLVNIGSDAFGACSSLEVLDLPSGVKYVPAYAFSGCSSLREVSLPAGLHTIYEGAFAACTALTEIDIPEKCQRIEKWAFRDCANLLEITVNEAYWIGEECFVNCTSLKHAYLHSHYDGTDSSVFKGAFRNCASLEYVHMPPKCMRVCEEVFSGCTSLKFVDLNARTSSIDPRAFDGCSSMTVFVNSFTTFLGENAFRGVREVWYEADEEKWNTVVSNSIQDWIPGSVKSPVTGDTKLYFNHAGHTSVQVPDIESTCTETGLTGMTVCAQCGFVISPGEATPAAHRWSERIVDVQPTYLKSGSSSIHCLVCGTVIERAAVPVLQKTSLENCRVSLSYTEHVYTGSALKPTVTIKAGSTVVPSTYYTVTYGGNKKPGTASVKVTAKAGNIPYKGTIGVNFEITPKGVSIKKLTAMKKAIKVDWKKQTAPITGYQIRWSTSKKMTKASKVNMPKNCTPDRIIAGLKGGKRYYFQMRTYYKTGGKTYYSAWSAKKYKTTKK